MSRFREDPLFGIARAILTACLVLVGIGFVGAIVGLGGVAIFYSKVMAEIAESGGPASAYFVIVGMILMALVLIAMVALFITHLRHIVDTVADGDPFIPVNAMRLAHMAWLSLGIFVMTIPVSIAATWLEKVLEHGQDIEVETDFDINTLFLVLTLFILARVFRKGSQMREELEGTV
ncbi:DUF2975 domain-containing protein [Croceicoccus ponticola]|uniref:DUF2975 domain-containing protein n=1 Tax=Croceicoccus ponticola TaxID=2217664 RepID=A0A437GYQ8_9SPHN|nr:DUF2975 domain-containing protein [Croceicoccus ponticola]RVQ67812.1 DUF2975 domain-containing protein [Croceicoccus ponticola]